jgi:NAD(P)-dependent dehydrogenase (short-subunit alcohol dehydrogenase family)
MRLKGMNCVVTGGSSGIGVETVRRFVAEGVEVLIADFAIDDAQV